MMSVLSAMCWSGMGHGPGALFPSVRAERFVRGRRWRPGGLGFCFSHMEQELPSPAAFPLSVHPSVNVAFNDNFPVSLQVSR